MASIDLLFPTRRRRTSDINEVTIGLASYFTVLAKSTIRFFVLGDTSGALFNARDTVVLETPASLASSRIVILMSWKFNERTETRINHPK